MEAVITQNLLNFLNAYNTQTTYSSPGDLPTEFSNSKNVDGGRNVITMSTGTFTNNVYHRVPNPESQKLVRVCRNSIMKSTVTTGTTEPQSSIAVYNHALEQTSRFVQNSSDYALISPSIIARNLKTSDLFSESQVGFQPMLCNSNEAITLETTDMSGDIISYSNSILSTTYNEDGSLTIVYRSTVPSTLANFTLKSILFTSAGALSCNWYSASSFPPIIFWGIVLNEPIELGANDSVKISVTYKTNFTA